MDAADVERAVLVPPSFEGDYNDVAIAAARCHVDRLAVMARFDPMAPDAAMSLRALMETPEIRGFRMTYHRPEMHAKLDSPAGEWFWAALAADSIPVMIYAPGQNAALRDVGARHPQLRMIVDAVGLALGMRDDEIDAPIADVLTLADNPNIAVKVTALPAHVSDDYPFRSLAPRLRTVMDVFGMRRVFWASDLTRVPRPYSEIVTFASDLGVLTTEELTWLMGRGISTWLNWPTRQEI
jgi:predicted TIM-barrel fold metal-dependent hydrolase